jgi:hypothetical protein
MRHAAYEEGRPNSTSQSLEGLSRLQGSVERPTTSVVMAMAAAGAFGHRARP